MSRGNQSLQAYAVFVVAPGRNTLHSDTKASRPAELRVSRTGNKNVPSEERDYFLFKLLIHGPMDCDYRRVYYILGSDSKICHLLKNPAPAFQAAAT